MPTISTTSLANGGRVELSTPEIPRNGSYDLVAQLFDGKGALVRSIVVDTARNSDGSTAPSRSEGFDGFSVVGLSGGGFAVAYDNTTLMRPGGGSNVLEVHFYDAAGGALGARSLGTSTGGQPYPFPGSPQLTASSTNGVFVVAHLSDGRTHLLALGSNGAIEGDRIYATRPNNVYDAGYSDQVVVTFATDGAGQPVANPVREVLTHSLNLVSSSSITETRGTENGDILTGSANADLLVGQGGPDTLQGGASFDSLTGGPGGDKFVFALDGSVDQVTDFDVTQDKLALVDASDAPLNASTGILTFWRSNGVLTYDPDGDQGSAAAQTVAVLPGVKTLTQANLAAGYEPALLRVYNPISPAQAGQEQGSRSDLTFGFGKQPYVSASADYNAAGTLLTYGVSFADGTSSMKWFDTKDAQPWENLVADYDAQGRLNVYATYDDDGSHVLWRYDSNSNQTWQRIVDHFDAQGRVTSRDVVSDDGSRFAAIYDVAGTEPWGYAVEYFNASGVRTGRSLFNDDGSPFG